MPTAELPRGASHLYDTRAIQRHGLTQVDSEDWAASRGTRVSGVPVVFVRTADEPPKSGGSHRPEDFPYWQFLRVRRAIVDVVCLLDECVALRPNMSEIRRRTRRWVTMLETAITGNAERVSIRGVFDLSVWLLEQAVFAGRIVDSRNQKTWERPLERLERCAHEWKDANGGFG